MGEKGENSLMNNIQHNIQQTEIPFKLKITSDCITPKSGLLFFVNIANQIGLTELINNLFPLPKSNRGIKAYDYIMSIILMLIGGGRYLEDIREIKVDEGLKKICGIKKVPSADAIARFLRDKENIRRVKKVIEYLNKEIIKRDKRKDYTLDVDATLLETEKNKAEMTYKGYRGNSVLLSFLPEIDLCIYDEYREGNVHAGSKVLEQIKYAYEFLNRLNKNLTYFRSDSAAYSSEIINYCFEKGIMFTITADQDISVKTLIKSIPFDDWKPLYDKYGVLTDREYAVTVHCMNNSENAFTLIIQRWEDKQSSLFDEYKYNYYVIATNNFNDDPQSIIHFHNQRGNSENYNKELKTGFGLEHVPTQDIYANALFFKLGIIAYNLTIALKRLVLQGDWINKTISTLRWQLVFIAAKVVYHSRQLFIKLKHSCFSLFNSILFKIPASLSIPFS